MNQEVSGREARRDYESNQKFEHELINRKTTWLLTSQTIMFAAYGVALDSGCDKATEFGCIVASTAIAIAAFVFVGVIAVINSKRLAHNEYRESHDENAPWGADTTNTIVSLLPDIFLPLIFVFAWAWLLL